jgi:hypothetical protein
MTKVSNTFALIHIQPIGVLVILRVTIRIIVGL